MSTDFQVDVEALQLLGGRFTAAADAVLARAAALAPDAELSGQALGWVAEAAGVEAEYRRQLQDAVDGLGRLSRALSQVGANLAAAADNYEASDRAIALDDSTA